MNWLAMQLSCTRIPLFGFLALLFVSAAFGEDLPSDQARLEEKALIADAAKLRQKEPGLFGGAQGIVVTQVVPKSQGEKAGLRRGDIILRYGSANVDTRQQFIALVTDQPVGSKVDIRFLRDRVAQSVTVNGGRLGMGIRNIRLPGVVKEISHHNQRFQLETEISTQYPELIQLILTSESMEDAKRQEWLDSLSYMSEDEIARLFDILNKERTNLEQAEQARRAEEKAAADPGKKRQRVQSASVVDGKRWLLYKGVLAVKQTSGASCTGLETRRVIPMNVVFEQLVDPPRTTGFLYGDGIAVGRITAKEEGTFAVEYPFLDPHRASGHSMVFNVTDNGEATAVIKERPLTNGETGCNYDRAEWKGELAEVDAVARTKIARLAREFSADIAEEQARTRDPATATDVARLRDELVSVDEGKDVAAITALADDFLQKVEKLQGKNANAYAEALILAAKVYVRIGEKEQALSLLGRSLEIYRSENAYLTRVRLLRDLNRDAEALATITAWDAWLAQTPWSTERIAVADLVLQWGIEKETGNKHDEALRLLRMALVIDRDQRPLFAAAELGWIAVINLLQQQLPAAREALQEALVIYRKRDSRWRIDNRRDVLIAPVGLYRRPDQRAALALACRSVIGVSIPQQSLLLAPNTEGAALVKEISSYLADGRHLEDYLVCSSGFPVELASFLTTNRDYVGPEELSTLLYYDIARPDKIGVNEFLELNKDTMLGDIFRKYSTSSENSSILVEHLVDGLLVPYEKKLHYLVRYDSLDDAAKLAFYKKLTVVIDQIESNEMSHFPSIMSHLSVIKALGADGGLQTLPVREP